MLDATTEGGARADRRLQEEEVAWLTTVRSNGQPRSVPIWFLWDGEKFLIYSQQGIAGRSGRRGSVIWARFSSVTRGGDR